MSTGKRYKFQGSTVAVQTGFGATTNISGATAANPVVITATGHGRAEADVVRIASVVGMTQLNGNLYVVDDPDTNTFELAGVNGVGYTAYVSGGTIAPVTFTPFCELTGISQQGAAADETEVTTICSTAKEFEVGLRDSGSLTLDYNWAGNQAVQAALKASEAAGSAVAIRITFPGDGGKVVMIGYVQSTSFTGAVNGVWTGSATIRLTGDIFVTT